MEFKFNKFYFLMIKLKLLFILFSFFHNNTKHVLKKYAVSNSNTFKYQYKHFQYKGIETVTICKCHRSITRFVAYLRCCPHCAH